MNALLNYLIEANLGLIFFYTFYWLLLRNENQFGFKRIYLLGSLIASLLFPVISIPSYGIQLIPSLSHTTAVHWLPEITIYANTEPQSSSTTQLSIWQWITYFYLAGLIVFFILFLIRISALIFLFKTSRKYSWKNYEVAESEKAHGSFSFFHFIFL